MAPKNSPRVKKSSKSGFFSQPKTMLETELKPLEKHKKCVQIHPPKVNNHIIFNPGPADCAKRLQSARPLCLQRGAWGVLDPRLDSSLFLTPLKVSPVAPRIPLYPSSSAPLWSPFFQSLTELTNLARIITFCASQAPKMIFKSGKKRSANLFEKHFRKTTRF